MCKCRSGHRTGVKIAKETVSSLEARYGGQWAAVPGRMWIDSLCVVFCRPSSRDVMASEYIV